jgi:hypothetical protein
LVVFAIQTAGCGAFRAMGLSKTSDLQRRKGIAGTADAPFVLNPLVPHTIVMSAKECRYFQVQIPSRWYWKVMLTAATRQMGRSAGLEAELLTQGEGWKPVVPYESQKTFLLNADSSQGVVAVANNGPDRVLVLKLCQEGASVKVILDSQVSAFGNALLVPPLKKTLDEAGH